MDVRRTGRTNGLAYRSNQAIVKMIIFQVGIGSPIGGPFSFVSCVSCGVRLEHPLWADQQLSQPAFKSERASLRLFRRCVPGQAERPNATCIHVTARAGDPSCVIGVFHVKSNAPQSRDRLFRCTSRLRCRANMSPGLVFLQDEHRRGVVEAGRALRALQHLWIPPVSSGFRIT